MGDIANALDVQSPYVTGILRTLEAKKLISIRADTQDRRVRTVTTTKKGKSMASAIDTDFIEQGEILFGYSSFETLQHYLAVLELLAQGRHE